MPLLSMTRFKLKSYRLLPKVLRENKGIIEQLQISSGFIAGKTLIDPQLGLWTTTLWESEADMHAFYTSGAHRLIMPKLAEYACEAVATHIETDSQRLPSWEFVHDQLSKRGTFSLALKETTPDHDNKYIAPPKITLFTIPIKPKMR